MDPASMHYPASGDHHPLSHDAHHHPSQLPPPQAFRISALSSHPTVDLPIDAHDTIFQHHLQRLNALSNMPVVHAGFAHAHHPAPGTLERDQPPAPTPAAHIQRHSSISQSHPPQPQPQQLQLQLQLQHQHQHQHQHQTPPRPLTPHPGPPSQHHFGLLSPNAPISQSSGMPQISPEEDAFAAQSGEPSLVTVAEPAAEQRPHGQLVNRIVIDPPNLQAWREKLFNVDDTILLTNDEFETYFPHIDNVYSHRSTQKYKRKNFISHYWDCRMKGRPPGTPKSDDPAKKKRKRFARERDLCDVKIKITEHFPDATFSADGAINTSPSTNQPPSHQSPDGIVRPLSRSGTTKKYWTIQRVNGNGGNGKGDGVPGPHKHTLQKSDEIKKSTVQRFLAQQEKEARKGQKPVQSRRPSGTALVTAKKHSKEHHLKLYAASFCPFSQRVWIALEAKGMSYQYCETDPFKRPTQLLEANPRGLVPAIRQGDWASGESTVILEYLEDFDRRVPLLPTDPRLKANCRLWIDHVVPAFFTLMRNPDSRKQAEYIDRLRNDILALVQAADERGPYFLGGDLCLVDVHLAPFVLRMSRILCGLRNWHDPVPGARWQQWSDALEQNTHVQATTSQDELYVETVDLFMRCRPHDGEQPLC
ncbi:hypothetical protein F5Y14DRAFT_136573 [Nemania sp. NC0429]|nr:hypothetical protein F5Y14DRAFT_136573 [Nemania sp. NC0429]